MRTPPSCRGVKVAGVDMHIGSQITDLRAVRRCLRAARRISCANLRADGHTITHVDLGGGLGIPYRDDNEPPPIPDAYAAVVKRATRDLGCKLIFEPGRLIVGNAGILVTRVLFVKRGEAKNFVIVDAAMNDLIRPTLYEAHHEIWPVDEKPAAAPPHPRRRGRPGLRKRRFPGAGPRPGGTAPGDLLAVMTAGAYGAVQAGTYNTRALVPEVLVNGAEWAVVRPRLEVDQLIALDRLPAGFRHRLRPNAEDVTWPGNCLHVSVRFGEILLSPNSGAAFWTT